MAAKPPECGDTSMSFDPFGHNPEPNPPPGGPPGTPMPPVSATGPVGPGTPLDPEAARARARERVTLPAIFLIIIGAFNILLGGFSALNGLAARNIPAEEIKEQSIKSDPKNQKAFDDLAKQGYSFETVLSVVVNGMLIGGLLGVLFAILIILGGIRMLQMKNYGLAMFSTLLAAIPCLSGSACCGVGEIVALWSIVVLLQGDVRAAFR
jgi:hypothetical protein